MTGDYAAGALHIRRVPNPVGRCRDLLWIDYADRFVRLPRRGLTVVSDIHGASSLEYPCDSKRPPPGGKPGAMPWLSDVQGWLWVVRAANATLVYTLVRYLPEQDVYEAEGRAIARWA